MLVGELVAELLKADQGLPVMVGGYEGGLDDVTGTGEAKYVKFAHADEEEWYHGLHGEAVKPREEDGTAVLLITSRRG